MAMALAVRSRIERVNVTMPAVTWLVQSDEMKRPMA